MNVGLIIVGSEILAGRVRDTNSGFLAQRLFARGARVREIATVPDDVPVVAAKVREFSEKYDLVIATGGIGPTHDDITYEAVALGLGLKMVHSAKLKEVILRKIPAETEVVRKMSMVPEGAVLLSEDPSVWPPVKVRNVVVLPGIPSLIEALFPLVEELIPASPFSVAEVKCHARETELASAAGSVSKEFPDVEVGSYPMSTESGKHVVIRFTSKDGSRTQQAVAAFMAQLPRGIVTSPPEIIK